MTRLITTDPPNTALHRTRQLTRFRRQTELTLDDREIARDRYSRRAGRHASPAFSSLGEQGFQVLQDEILVGSTVERNPSIRAGAFSPFPAGLSSEHQRTGCQLNRVKIPRLRAPLSFKTFGHLSQIGASLALGVLYLAIAAMTSTDAARGPTPSPPYHSIDATRARRIAEEAFLKYTAHRVKTYSVSVSP